MPKQYALVTLDDGRRFYREVPRRSMRGMRAYPRGFGQSMDLTSIGNVAGAAVGVPGAGDVISGVASTIQSIFGGNPATGANAERQAHIYSIYETAMTSPGSSASVGAVVELYTIANNLYDPINRVQQNNPQATRTYAQQALQQLATQGWQNVNSLNPVFTGVPASGAVYAANPQTGQETQVAVRPISGGMGSGTLLVVAIIGGLVILSGRGKATATATVHHQNPRYRRRRKSNRRRRSRR